MADPNLLIALSAVAGIAILANIRSGRVTHGTATTIRSG